MKAFCFVFILILCGCAQGESENKRIDDSIMEMFREGILGQEPGYKEWTEVSVIGDGIECCCVRFIYKFKDLKWYFTAGMFPEEYFALYCPNVCGGNEKRIYKDYGINSAYSSEGLNAEYGVDSFTTYANLQKQVEDRKKKMLEELKAALK